MATKRALLIALFFGIILESCVGGGCTGIINSTKPTVETIELIDVLGTGETGETGDKMYVIEMFPSMTKMDSASSSNKSINPNWWDSLSFKPRFLDCESAKENEARVCFEEGIHNFITKHIKYPSEAKRLNIQGKIFTTFIYEVDGTISNVLVLRDIGGGCGDEVLRVIKSLPSCTPGKLGGKNVRLKFKISINFSL